MEYKEYNKQQLAELLVCNPDKKYEAEGFCTEGSRCFFKCGEFLYENNIDEPCDMVDTWNFTMWREYEEPHVPKFKVGDIIRAEGYPSGHLIIGLETDKYLHENGIFPTYFEDEDDYELVEEPTYYYQWEKLSNSTEGIIVTSDYMTNEVAEKFNYITDGFRRIESSKRTWDKS